MFPIFIPCTLQVSICMFVCPKVSKMFFKTLLYMNRATNISLTVYGIINLINSTHNYLLLAASAFVLLRMAVRALSFSRS
nr:MAG TPA: hypothetical protein [Caudoviricetes sp.]